MAAATLESSLPLRIGPLADFVQVREFFRRASYDAATFCRALKMGDMSDFGKVRWEEIRMEDLDREMRWCINVFARGLPAPEAESRSACGEEAFAAFLSLGLLRPAKNLADSVRCPVWIYPVDGFVVASDLCQGPDGESFGPAADAVFPGIYAGTLRFLELLPDGRGGDALDLCGGSGIGALHLARTARTVASADLSDRASFFAEFNAQLNGASITTFSGDLYEPVAGRQFDLITAHPPFVPAIGPSLLYRDGGETGEDVIRRVIEGLPDHLRPGGTGMILCVARDTVQHTFEQRAKEWLGPAMDQFDVVFGLEHVMTTEAVVQSLCKRRPPLGAEQERTLLARLRECGTRQFVYGCLFVRREAPAPLPSPSRVNLTLSGRAADFERVLAWRHHCRQKGFSDWLAQSRPRLAPQLQLTVRHAVQVGELAPVEFVFSVETGLQAGLRPDGWVVPLIARLEGKLSVAELIKAARLADELPQGFTLEAFLDLVRMMIERGFLEVDFPAP